MSETAPDVEALWRAAKRLRRRSGWGKRLPPLFFFTDPVRTPQPERVARRLPPGCGVVYRAFGGRGALATARELAAICGDRGLILLVGADADLADGAGAHGLHLPERMVGKSRALLRARPQWIITGAAHSPAALRRAGRLGLDAAFVSPVFDSASRSAAAPLGPRRFRRWVSSARLPVYALGGVDMNTAQRLMRTGAAGAAAVEGVVGKR